MSNSVNLSLDVTKTGIQNPLIKVRQGDGGFETLHTTVTSNGEPLDLQGWTITFMGTTAGNHKIVDGNVNIIEAPNGIFDYTPSKAWGMDIGDFKIAYFKFVKGDGSASSANFRVNVIEAVDLTQEEAKDYISVVDTTITEINQHLTDSLANVTQSIADANANANTVASNVTALGNRVDDYNNKLASIQVGGRNLLVGTHNFDGDWWTFYQGTVNKSDFQGLASTSATEAWSGPKYKESVLENQGKIVSTSTQYVLSAWVNNTGTSPIDVHINSSDIDSNDQKIATIPANSGWVRIASNPFKFTKTTGLSDSLSFNTPTNVQGGVFKQSGLKLEIGNIATDWTPSPEDVPSNDAQLVHKTGTETVAGDKTFTGNNKFTAAIDGSLKTRDATFTDFATVANDMFAYAGNWFTKPTASVANSPYQNAFGVVEVIPGDAKGSGRIIFTPYDPGDGNIYYNSVSWKGLGPWLKVANDNDVVHDTGNETVAGDKTFTGKVTVPGTLDANQKVYTRTIGSTNDLQIIYTRAGNVVTGRFIAKTAGTFSLTGNDGYKSTSGYPVNAIGLNVDAFFTTDNKFITRSATEGNFVFITSDAIPTN